MKARTINRVLRTLRQDRGAVALLGAAMLAMTVGFAALAVDVGSMYAARRSLQGATDAAALAAVYGLPPDPRGISGLATTYMGLNGYTPSATTTVTATPGRYCPVITTTPSTRFTANAGSASTCPGDAAGSTFGIGQNAVQVVANTRTPLYLSRVLMGGSTTLPVSTTATAALLNEAGLMAGTTTVSLSNGIVNSMLSTLLGSSINLSLAGYNGLVSTNVDALSFFNALATQVGVTAGTYGSLLQGSATIQQVLGAAVSVLNTNGSVASLAASSTLANLSATITGSPQVALGNLFDVGIWQNDAIGFPSSKSALSAGLNLLNLVTASAQAANGSHFVNLPSLTVGVPGIAQITAATTAIEPPQSAVFAFGPTGVTVHTAQVRTQLTLTVLNTSALLGALGSLASVVINIPLYLEVGSGTATITGISCGLNPSTDAVVTVSAQPAVITAYLGTISQSVMTNFSSAVAPPSSPATLGSVSLLGIPIISITASAVANIGSPSATTLTFPQPLPGTQTVSSSSMLTALSTSLGSSLTLNLSLLGTPILPITLSAIKTLVVAAITPVFGVLDQLLNPLLAALGVRLGSMDVTVTGVRCGVPSLVL